MESPDPSVNAGSRELVLERHRRVESGAPPYHGRAKTGGNAIRDRMREILKERSGNGSAKP